MNVPFDFIVGDTPLPAGAYVVADSAGVDGPHGEPSMRRVRRKAELAVERDVPGSG